ncbi:hypothetical protein ECFRIK1999_3920, partial [Escherichia coli FRIK1999]
NHL